MDGWEVGVDGWKQMGGGVGSVVWQCACLAWLTCMACGIVIVAGIFVELASIQKKLAFEKNTQKKNKPAVHVIAWPASLSLALLLHWLVSEKKLVFKK